ncbi:hypothetical protein JTE90_016416 [Oedothorax gibbosus]|uniref:Uncharacterized protein n=1 Tax=Oedothorax gibbosus TaxID=931172 RepID=A0AAV6U6L1_9ARAC|nr:hypothetical protein JTE90_016416 [Oedothorax gibbosus]
MSYILYFAKPLEFCSKKLKLGQSSHMTVLYRRYHSFSKRRFKNLVIQLVKRRQPGTRYLFEVPLTKIKGQVLTYEQLNILWTMTIDT